MHTQIITVSCITLINAPGNTFSIFHVQTRISNNLVIFEEMIYLFKFIEQRNGILRSSVEAKRGVEFRHSTRNAYRLQRKVGKGVS